MKNPQLQAAGAQCSGTEVVVVVVRGDGSTARVSMHIHASPPHRLTATTLR